MRESEFLKLPQCVPATLILREINLCNRIVSKVVAWHKFRESNAFTKEITKEMI